MESQQIQLKIYCPTHSTELIQRVNTDLSAKQHLFCIDCIIQNTESPSISSKLKTIPELIDIISTVYTQNKRSVSLGSQPPSEYLDLVSKQDEKLEKLTNHIEEEKKKISHIFDTVLEDTVKTISEKKNEYLQKLDQQVFNLQSWYISFGKLLRKTYPSEIDIPFLYPSKEDLIAKFEKMTNTTQLIALVRSLIEDLREEEKRARLNYSLERIHKTSLLNLNKELPTIENILPAYKQEFDIVGEVKLELNNKITELLGQFLPLENPIKDVFSTSNYGSEFVSPDGFDMIQEWLPKDCKFAPRLLYRASRDGFEGEVFHDHCDNEANTITFIKAQFSGSLETCIIGGYLDKPWHSKGGSINTKKSFIFSLTSQVKCIVKNPLFAAQGDKKMGPTFGFDICVYKHFSKDCALYPQIYEGTEKLVVSDSYEGNGEITFELKDIEVYTLGTFI